MIYLYLRPDTYTAIGVYNARPSVDLRSESQSMAKHIGIVGCSAEGAALCYRTICKESEAAMGEHRHPEVSMHTTCLADYHDLLLISDWRGVGELMAQSARKLADIGAEFAISPDNTIHEAFDEAAAASPISWLHIADCVAQEARSRGYTKVGVTGTAFLTAGPVYPDALDRVGIAHEIPDDASRQKMNDIIFGQLVKGQFTDEARGYFNDVFASLRARGCDAVVMGCTEIPILMDCVDTAIPTLDSTRILARAAIRYALESN